MLPMDYVHGLFEFAIYGGRVDNAFDIRVMVSYLMQFFDNSIIGDSARDKKLGPLKMPNSAEYRVRLSSLACLCCCNIINW